MTVRVVYVIDSLVAHGAETSLADLAPAHADHGIALEVAYLRPRRDLAPRFAAAGVPVHDLSGAGGRAGTVRALRSLLAERRPDLVHTALYEASVLGRLAARSLGLSVVTTHTNTSYDPAHLDDPSLSRRKVRLAQGLDAATARLAVRHHAVSDAVARSVVARLGIDPTLVDVVPRSRSRRVLGHPGRRRRARARARLGLADDVPVLVNVGRHEHAKGQVDLVAAVAHLTERHRDLVCLIAGSEGRATARLEAAVADARLGERIRLLGRRDDVPDLLVAADVVVVASSSEGLPGTVIEAMALEAPLVATAIDPVREALRADDLAVLVPPGDARALARAVEQTLADPDGAAGRSARARRVYEDHYTADAVMAAMADVYRRALVGRRGRSVSAEVPAWTR